MTFVADPLGPHVHCRHSLQLYAFKNGEGKHGTVCSTRCCYCGEVDIKRTMTVRDPEHGPFGFGPVVGETT